VRVARLHVIVDVHPSVSDPVGFARLVLAGGGRLLQVRCKEVSDRDAYEAAARIAELCRMHGAECVINDRADIALAVDAPGCHVGALDLAVPVVRRLLGGEALVGGTARDPATAKDLVVGGADYVGVGPVYATSSKIGLPDPLGPGVIAAVSAAVDVPVIAISGVTVERVPELVAAGAYGVAVIGAIARAADPRAATFGFVAALADAVGDR
jgi:thiamine-phosphate pyrophosphorylase